MLFHIYVRSTGLLNAKGISSFSRVDKRAACSSRFGIVNGFNGATHAFPITNASSILL